MAGIYEKRASPNFQEQLNLLILALKSQKICASRKSTNEERYKRLHHGFNVVDGRKLDQAGNKPKAKRFDRVMKFEDTTKKDELKAAVEKANKFKEQLKNFSFNFPQKNKDKPENVTRQFIKVEANVKNPNDNKATLSNIKREEAELEYKVDHTYFVLDTNVLIEDLELLETVNKLKLFGTAGSVLYIPYIVFKELDGLKQNNVTGFAARRAIEYLDDRFDDKDHTNIGAQSAVDDLIHIVDIDNPDDSIINCCLQIQRAVPHMMLLTNDKNLRLKARATCIMVSTCLQLTSPTSRKRSSHRNRRANRHRRRRSFI